MPLVKGFKVDYPDEFPVHQPLQVILRSRDTWQQTYTARRLPSLHDLVDHHCKQLHDNSNLDPKPTVTQVKKAEKD